MTERIFKLRTPTLAILRENERRSIVTIPTNGLVRLVIGDIDGDGFVKVRYQNQALVMVASDLRNGGDRVSEHDVRQDVAQRGFGDSRAVPPASLLEKKHKILLEVAQPEPGRVTLRQIH